jgi:hypothetical protein
MCAMEIATYIITAIVAVALTGAGVSLCWRKQPGSTAAVTALLSFGFLMLLLLHMSKFKHVKGFGFDAETWDEKQVQAAELLDKLSSTSEALSHQTALLASRLGLWDSGLTNPELADILQRTEKQLEAGQTQKSRQNEILAPIKRRIAPNYWRAAQNLIDKTYMEQHDELMKANSDRQKQEELIKEMRRIDDITVDMPRNLEPLITAIKNSKLFNVPKSSLTELNEIDTDLRFFDASGQKTLRRNINLEELYPSPPLLTGR